MHSRPATLAFPLAITLSLAAGIGQADIYRWTDAEGKLHFGDRAPARDEAKAMQLSTVNTYASPEIAATPGNGSNLGQPGKVVMYSASWCGVCKKARRYFRGNGVRFTEYDIEKDAKGKRDFAKLGGRGVPLILVGKQRMSGFSPTTFDSLHSR